MMFDYTFSWFSCTYPIVNTSISMYVYVYTLCIYIIYVIFI